MDLRLKEVNALPVRTWNWLGVNGSVLEEEIRELSPLPERQALSLPGGVTLAGGAFAEAAEIASGMGTQAEAFVTESRNAGRFLQTEPGAKVREPVFLDYVLDAHTPALADYNTILARENSELTVVMRYRSEGDAPVFHGGLTKILAGAGAMVRLVQVQLLNDDTVHFNDVGVLTQEGASVEVVQVEFGGRSAFSGCKARLEGRASRFEADTVYLGDRSRVLDMNYIAEHVGRDTQSEMHANGALMDDSQKIYRGTIDFVRGTAYSVGHESEYTLLFSPRVRNRTAPLILCGEENVEGQHAASIGRIDENKLFYLMSRGLSETEAKRLMIEAQFAPALGKIPLEALRAEILEWLKERINKHEILG